MSFTDGKPFIATEKDTKLRWSGGKPGEFFRCGFCGVKFQAGDTVRWVFTNDTPGAGGNPFVCEKCDAPRDELLARRKEMFKIAEIVRGRP